MLQAFGTADVKTVDIADALGVGELRGWRQLGVAETEDDAADEAGCEELPL